jgi:hypothetical protein
MEGLIICLCYIFLKEKDDRKTVTFYSENRTYEDTLCIKLLIVKAGGTYGYNGSIRTE